MVNKLKHTKLIIISLILAALMLLSSCGAAGKSYAPEDYMLEMDFKDNFRILQMGDVHLANKDDRQIQYDFMTQTIEDSKADLIVFTGDIFTFADKAVVKEFCKWIDAFGIPWAATFGNHDEQCYFPIDWLTSYFNKFGSNCVFKDLQDDDVYGNANYAINLKQGGKTQAQLIIMDSNRYDFGEIWDYDHIKEDQIAWYESIVKTTAEQSGRTVPSVAFFHIPLPEFAVAWEEAQKNTKDAALMYGEKNENVCCPPVNSGLFDKMLELGSTKAVCCSHDHINNFRVNYKGIELSYGINANDRIYGDYDMMGGKVIVLHSDGTVGFEAIYETYDEVK